MHSPDCIRKYIHTLTKEHPEKDNSSPTLASSNFIHTHTHTHIFIAKATCQPTSYFTFMLTTITTPDWLKITVTKHSSTNYQPKKNIYTFIKIEIWLLVSSVTLLKVYPTKCSSQRKSCNTNINFQKMGKDKLLSRPYFI